jgi:hypothetical protein
MYDLHHFESDTECLEFIISLLADNMYLFPIAQHMQGGVRGQNPTRSKLKVANNWRSSTVRPGGSNRTVNLHQILS